MKLNCLGLSVLTILAILKLSHALYEDQVGKFDWRRLHIGKPIAIASLNTKYSDRILVATEDDVIAALSVKTGEIIWRQILEDSPRGKIDFVHFLPEDDSVPSLGQSNNEFDIITVSGTYPSFVRGWSSNSGNIVFEWSPTFDPKAAKKLFWFYKDSYLYLVAVKSDDYLEVTEYNAMTGDMRAPPKKVDTKWPFEGTRECEVSDTYYICVDEQNRRRIMATDLSDNKPRVERTISVRANFPLKPIQGYKGVFLVNNHELVIFSNALATYDPTALKESLSATLQSSFSVVLRYEQNDLLVTMTKGDEMVRIDAFNFGTSGKSDELGMDIPLPKEHGSISTAWYECYKGRSASPTCVAFIITADSAVLFVKNGNVEWVREESLARIAAVELIDLPLSGTQSAFETEIQKTTDEGSKYDLWGAFICRIQSQLHLIKNAWTDFFGVQAETRSTDLIRDAFGLHKMLVILTESGKLFGIGNISGEKLWAVYHSSFAKFNSREGMKIIVQRTSKYSPHQPLCTVLARDAITGRGIMYRFSPISGEAFDNGPIQLPYKIKQIALLRENDKDHTKGILLLDKDNEIHVIPQNATEMAEGMYIYVANKTTADMEGYYIQSVNGKLELLKVWSIKLGNSYLDQHLHSIIAIAAKNPIERVHSQGRVLGDRSVLYKYLNPNLVAVVVASSPQSANKDMNVHLVDVVSGSVVYSMTHRKVRGPVHIVNSENWLVYSYFNEKARRTELTTVELYEGKVQSNSTVWSSLEAPPFPIIEKQSFVIPTTVEAMRETITERGITNKHVLIGTSSGGIAEMSWALLDPRRPTSNQAREEGSIPYIPELGIPSETVINYNQSIARLKEIATAPSGLESTCLVVAYGLDLFVTRVSPSKTFDLLKEDFDYMLISLVLIGLIVVSLIVHHLSSRKALKQAWK